ncbi:hypothetical protein NL676_017782 [Syzygium grande]|nr:hypothetical protein NL676_017782 [Syzygium grande]
MVGPPSQASEAGSSPPSLSPSSSPLSSAASSSTPKAVIDNLCTHVADTTLTSDDVQHDHGPYMQSQDTAKPVQARPPVTCRPPALPPLLSLAAAAAAVAAAAAAVGDSPMELCPSDGVGGGLLLLPPEGAEDECKTPRGEEYRIPEPLTCPPAPKRSRRHWSERRACAAGEGGAGGGGGGGGGRRGGVRGFFGSGGGAQEDALKE